MPDDPLRWFEKLSVELDPDRLDEGMRNLGERLKRVLEQGRYTRVRFKFRGKPLLPDLPLAALVATEVASLWWMGPLQALVLTLGVKTFIEVEFIHAAGEKVQEGQEKYMAGEVEAAEAAYREALRMRPGDPSALYNLGILLKVTGRKDEARKCLREAAAATDHPDAVKAKENLDKMGG